MGCDIHTIAQVKKNGKWETVADNIADEWRSYDSFAVLANIRNGYGFAGVSTGEGWPYISEPKGLPSDLEVIDGEHVDFKGENYDEEYDEVGTWLGEHSHSHHTLREIETFVEKNLPATYKKTGCITAQQFLELQEGKLPEAWSGGIGGANINLVTEKVALEGREPYTHVQATWEVPARDRVGYLMNVIEELKNIAKVNNIDSYEDVRFVFGFDS